MLNTIQTDCLASPGAALLWPETPMLPDLMPAEVHILASRLDDSPALDQMRSLLSRDEKDRSNRFLFDVHKARFIAGRAFLRTVLGRYLETNPSKIRFACNAQGKPALDPNFKKSDIKFNLAHSEDLALLAVTRLVETGVDVEYVRPLPEAADLVSRFFSSREKELFHKLPEDLQPAAFFNLWTRKEAWLKATGEGIAHSLKLVEVSFLPHEPARLLSLPAGHSAAQWMLRQLHPAPGFAAAVAVASFPIQVRCSSWPTQNNL